MQKISKGLFLGCIIGGEAVGMLLMFVGLVLFIVAGVMAAASDGDMSSVNWGLVGAGVVLFIVAMMFTFLAAIFGYILLYRSWKAIQDGQPRTTPGKAIGFLFIPFFNFYWIFIAYWGWAKDFNAYVASRGLAVPKVQEGLFLAFPILVLCSAVPYLGSLAGLAVIVVYIMLCNAMINSVNGLVASHGSPQQTVAVVQ
jgi:hypothetical protein